MQNNLIYYNHLFSLLFKIYYNLFYLYLINIVTLMMIDNDCHNAK